METLDIILKTATEVANEYRDWTGDVFDFVAMSSSVSQELTSAELKRFHKDFCGSSFSTENSEVFFYYSGRTPEISVIKREEKKSCGNCKVCKCRGDK